METHSAAVSNSTANNPGLSELGNEAAVSIPNAQDASEKLGNVSASRKSRSSHSQGKQRRRLFNCPGPFLECEDFPTASVPSSQPVPVRTALDLDERFFPSGIKPGHAVEVKGPENSGKTFLLTYFLAQLLTRYSTKTAVLIDTSHQFSLRNLVCIIAHLVKDPGEVQFNKKDASLTLSEILEGNPILNGYLDRLFVINCYSAEEFILTVGPKHSSTLQKMINSDPNLSLVAIDTVDNYSFAESFTSNDFKRFPNITDLISKAVGPSKLPVICTTMMEREYHARKNTEAAKASEKRSGLNNPDPEEQKTWFSNIVVEPWYFTHSIAITPATKAEKDKIPRSAEFKNAHYATAYLRSKHKANMAGSANHRVKFSIFSDMLWVDESGDGGDAPKK